MNADLVYRHTFNALAELLQYGNVINMHCNNRDECEKTLDIIKFIVETMNKQIERMEN